MVAGSTLAQSETASDVMKTLRKVNDYFMIKYADPTLPTNVNRVRPSSLWTRAVYYEGLMALYEIDKGLPYRKSHENPDIITLYKDFLGEPLSDTSHHLLHTTYHQVHKLYEVK